MRFGLLGVLRVVDDQGAERAVAAAKQRVLLAALLLNANRPVSRERLISILWDDEPPPSATASLRTYLARLREVLGEAGARISAVPSGLMIELRSAAELDVSAAEELHSAGMAAARRAQWADAAGLLQQAADLWRGQPLVDVPSEQLRRGELGRLEELRLQITEARIDAELELGADVVAELRSLVAANPLRERVHAQLMLALYRSERRGEALAAYRDARQVLREQLGADPSESLRELHQRMLSADPSFNPALVSQASALPTPRELPPDTAWFTGRAAELARLDDLLTQADKQPTAVVISAIAGTAGVGKTASAVHWAHTIRQREPDPFPDGCLYLDLRGFDPGAPMDPRDALAALLRSLGVADDTIPDGLAERGARYRSMLDQRRMLLVLDNVRDSEQVRPLLPGSPTCLVLVTSRDDLAGLVVRHGAHSVPLDLLTIQDAVALLRQLLGDARIDADPAAAETLAHRCARLPLALRIAAARAVARPDLPLSVLTRELGDEQRRLDVLRAGADSRTAVRAVFSWSLAHLTPQQARAFRLLGLHPGQDLDVDAAAALFDQTDLTETHENLDVLMRAHLLHETEQGRFAMHDLLRSYAHELSLREEPEGERRAAVTRLFDRYLHTAAAAMDAVYPGEQDRRALVLTPATSSRHFADPDAAHTWLSAEHANLMSMAAHAVPKGFPAYPGLLSATLSLHLELTGRCLDAATVNTIALQAARATSNRSGKAYQSSGHYTEAIDHARHALELACETGDHVAESSILGRLGIFYRYLGRYREAQGYYRESLDLARKVGNQRVVSGALNNLGETCLLLGNYSQALDYSRQGLAHARESGSRIHEGAVLINLGVIHQKLGDHQAAMEHLGLALTLARDTADAANEAYALVYVAGVHRSLSEHPLAIDYVRQALSLAGAIGNAHLEAEAHNGLGATLRAAGQPAAAREQYERTLALARDTNDRHQQASAHEGIADALYHAGVVEEARRHGHEALALYTELGVPEAGAMRNAPMFQP